MLRGAPSIKGQTQAIKSFAFHNNDNRFLYAAYFTLVKSQTDILKYDLVNRKITDSLDIGTYSECKIVLHPTHDKMYFIGGRTAGSYPSFYLDSKVVALNIPPLSIIKVLEPVANEQGTITYQTILKPGSTEFRWNMSKSSSGVNLCSVRNKAIFSTHKIIKENKYVKS
jgi:hypothetical protein